MPKALSISLNFMPAFFTKHTGITYGEPYYFEPEYRAEIQRTEGRFLFDILGRYDVGSPDPAPSPNIFIQPVDLIMRTQGAEWKCPPDATLESWGTPWAGLSPEKIEKIDALAAAHHPVINAIIDQYTVVERLYGDQADIFGTKSGVMNVHTPYTTAHQLCGEDLFVLMLTEPAGARVVFDKVWQVYEAVFARIRAVTGARFTGANMGDCSASLLSENLYRDVVLPVNQRISTAFETVNYHSCGASTHLLPAFAEFGALDGIELGPGTDFAAAVREVRARHWRPLVDPTVMRGGHPDSVTRLVGGILNAVRTAKKVTLCAWSFDRDTPIANVAALYDTVGASRYAERRGAATTKRTRAEARSRRNQHPEPGKTR